MLKLGIIGYPLSHSLSPIFQQAALDACKIKGFYKIFPTESTQLFRQLQQLEDEGFRGVNVTNPFKEKVLTFLTDVAPLAKTIGSVNTIIFENQQRMGYNTDMAGFLGSLDASGVVMQHKKILLIGAGGVARACAYGITLRQPAEFSIMNRTSEKAGSLCQIFNANQANFNDLIHLVKEFDVIVNATSQNLQEKLLPTMKLGSVCFDVNYHYPLQKKEGIQTIDGLSMLVMQGAAAFKLWTGVDAPEEVMRKAIQDHMKLISRK